MERVQASIWLPSPDCTARDIYSYCSFPKEFDLFYAFCKFPLLLRVESCCLAKILQSLWTFLFLLRFTAGCFMPAFLRCIALLPCNLSISLLLCINLYITLLYCSYILILVTFSIPGPSVLILSLRFFLVLTSEFVIDYFGFHALSFELTTLFFEFTHFPLFHFWGSSSVCFHVILVLTLCLSSWQAY